MIVNRLDEADQRPTLRVMRRLTAGLVVTALCPLSLMAQAREPSLERISLALQQPPPVIGISVIPDPPAPPVKLGPLRFVTPTGRGELVRVSIPVGELVSKAFKGVAHANHRRKEAAARREVEAALKQFASQQQR